MWPTCMLTLRRIHFDEWNGCKAYLHTADLANEHGNSYEISICKKKELISFNRGALFYFVMTLNLEI